MTHQILRPGALAGQCLWSPLAGKAGWCSPSDQRRASELARQRGGQELELGSGKGARAPQGSECGGKAAGGEGLRGRCLEHPSLLPGWALPAGRDPASRGQPPTPPMTPPQPSPPPARPPPPSPHSLPHPLAGPRPLPCSLELLPLCPHPLARGAPLPCAALPVPPARSRQPQSRPRCPHPRRQRSGHNSPSKGPGAARGLQPRDCDTHELASAHTHATSPSGPGPRRCPLQPRRPGGAGKVQTALPGEKGAARERTRRAARRTDHVPEAGSWLTHRQAGFEPRPMGLPVRTGWWKSSRRG
ncbi:uncharacterized protein LOC144455462 [Phascolarctos cinereus]